jgi:TolB-like protein/class 3 adenylate cyclase
MTESRIIRRLLAILVADVAGSSRLMGVDEAGTIEIMMNQRRTVGEIVTHHGGHLFGTTGDGFICGFESVMNALECALAIQRAVRDENLTRVFERRVEFRIGLNLGDVVLSDGDVLGDGVNVAARIEALAHPGGICVSASVRDQIGNKLPVSFIDMGEQRLKNIAEAVYVYRVQSSGIAGGAVPEGAGPRTASAIGFTRQDRPSIAVLPFENLGGNLTDDYFADGIVEELITELSRFHWLFVIARNSTFTYKGLHVDIKQVGRDLDVRYVVEGSVRKQGERIRVVAQLIDAATATHIWADRFDGDVTDIFAIQDHMTRSIASAIEPRLRGAELQYSRRKPTNRLDAYDYFLRALPHRAELSAEGNRKALEFLYRAIAIDPNYAPALAHAAMCINAQRDQGWGDVGDVSVVEALRLARAAVDVDMDDPVALYLGGHVIAGLGRELENGSALIDRALLLSPSSAEAWARSSMVRVYMNELETAIEHANAALRLNPLDPNIWLPYCALAYAYLFQHRYEEAFSAAKRSLQGKQKPATAYRLICVALGIMGREEASEAASVLLEREPKFRISRWLQRTPIRLPEHRDLMLAGFRSAGLPD